MGYLHADRSFLELLTCNLFHFIVRFSLEKMDRKKQRHFRGAHPKRYQADVESIVTSVRSRSINASKQPSARLADIIERRS